MTQKDLIAAYWREHAKAEATTGATRKMHERACETIHARLAAMDSDHIIVTGDPKAPTLLPQNVVPFQHH